ncbi:MAG: hypothetical protein ACOC4M_00470 [Promethearchaeia archaeon]
MKNYLNKDKEKKEKDYASKLNKLIDDFDLDTENLEIPDEEEKDKSSIEEAEVKGGENNEVIMEEEEEEEKKYILDPIETPVYLNWRAFKRMIGYAIRYANKDIDKDEWREVYGILIGSVEDETLVVIKDAIPLVPGGKTGVELEPVHYVDLSQIDESIYEQAIQNKKTDFIVGWWHTHPSFGFFFSEVDCYTHLGYQAPNPYAVGLVYDHTEMRHDHLGVAGLRLTEPEAGILSDYKIVQLHFDHDVDEMRKKVNKLIKNVKENMPQVLKDLEYIDQTLRRKALAQLQRNFGLIVVPKRDVKVVDDHEEAQEEEDKIYVWDPDFIEKKYRIPKYREKIEEKIKKYEEKLQELLDKGKEERFEKKREEYHEKMESDLEKPNVWHEKLLDDFNTRIERIYPYYDYLDTEERKIIEHFEERISKYSDALDALNSRIEFNIKSKKREKE